ncbi:AsmA-like C-terminal domain-containing protein [Hydrogenimonas thermophila]|uniref:YhdP central domain-containing protein n=1 Tax=Hydrogenimonas thermophila TaxID=223786 RepID=A0A1I5QH92_9BACT|nr:AsmA-like C-terminal domain-containing protein [Hydrogenimonas thermophila]SFP45593.1 Protein of unknown function [Hydrogenimonas thermophila]
MITTTTKILHSTILKIFLLISFLFILIIFLLAKGIEISEINLPGFKIQQFYIKLDKKLIISIKSVKIKAKKESSKTVNEVNNIVKVIQYLPHYFQKVNVENLQVGQKNINLLYDNNIFHIDTDILHLSSTLSYNPKLKVISVNIKELYLNDSQINLNGQFNYLIMKKKWTGKGVYKTFKINGSFLVTYENETINFKLNSNETSSIKELIDYIAPPEPIKVWIYPKIPAKRYKLHYLTGSIKLKKDGSIEFDPQKLKAFATAYNANIHFNSNVPPVSTKQIDITLKNNTLSFKLYDPIYEGKKLNGSYVQIRNLTNSKAELDAHIVVNDKIDNSIKTILSAYDIHLPFVQTEGLTDATVDFTVKLVTGEVIKYEGDYKSKQATLLFDDTIKLPVKNLHVISKDSKIIIKPCKISFIPHIDATINGSIDLYNKKGEFISQIKRLQYSYNSIPLIKIIDQKLPIKMNFNDRVTFEAPELNLIFSYKSGGSIKVVSKDIKPIVPYLKGPLLPIKGGKIEIVYSLQKLEADGFINYSNNFLTYNNQPIEKFSFQVKRDKLQTTAALNSNIFITLQKNRTFINTIGVDIYIDNLLKTIEPYTQKVSNKTKTTKQIFHIKGKNSILYYKNIELPCSSYSAILKTNPLNIKFISQHNDGEIRGIIEKSYINITGKQIPDYVIRKITTLDYIYGGLFDFNAIGDINNFKGTILVHNSLWAKNAFYNNVLAMLNTIPAVLTLKNPGFSNKGFKIKEGAIQYHYQDNILYFDNILMNGDSAQITGRGKINFKSETILMLMQIHFLENLTNILNKIPIAGYLIFGDDGTMAVTLNINGYLENPKVTTETVKDVVQVPLNILERTLKLPFKLFE